MTKIHFTLNSDEIQRIIEHSVQDDVSKHIFTTIFNQLMENQRTEYIQAESYERSNQRQSQRNEKALLASMLKIYISGISTFKLGELFIVLTLTLIGLLTVPSLNIYDSFDFPSID